jgi:hypothetical protein
VTIGETANAGPEELTAPTVLRVAADGTEIRPNCMATMMTGEKETRAVTDPYENLFRVLVESRCEAPENLAARSTALPRAGNPSQDLRDHFGGLIYQFECRLHYAGHLLYGDPRPGTSCSELTAA